MAMSSFIDIRALSFQYPTSTINQFDQLEIHFEKGFTGVVGANGSGKSTLLHLIAGQLTPDAGHITGNHHVVHCEQRTDSAPDRLDEFLNDQSGSAYAWRGRLGIEIDWLERWQHLSHGERKRAQIATALWQEPQVLTIDEPTNHIDATARHLLIENLKRFRGIGIIVSHDRPLLDELCQHTVWLESGAAHSYMGVQ